MFCNLFFINRKREKYEKKSNIKFRSDSLSRDKSFTTRFIYICLYDVEYFIFYILYFWSLYLQNKLGILTNDKYESG